jgi:hypothetical protein
VGFSKILLNPADRDLPFIAGRYHCSNTDHEDRVRLVIVGCRPRMQSSTGKKRIAPQCNQHGFLLWYEDLRAGQFTAKNFTAGGRSLPVLVSRKFSADRLIVAYCSTQFQPIPRDLLIFHAVSSVSGNCEWRPVRHRLQPAPSSRKYLVIRDGTYQRSRPYSM